MLEVRRSRLEPQLLQKDGGGSVKAQPPGQLSNWELLRSDRGARVVLAADVDGQRRPHGELMPAAGTLGSSLCLFAQIGLLMMTAAALQASLPLWLLSAVA